MHVATVLLLTPCEAPVRHQGPPRIHTCGRACACGGVAALQELEDASNCATLIAGVRMQGLDERRARKTALEQ
eukprot:2342965-Heterocapsa_arctica.AAC.1